MAIVIVRTVIIFAALLFCMRALGKRQLGELELSELVVSVLVADLASLPLQDIGIPMINGLVSILTLFCLELLLSEASLRSVKLRERLWGRAAFLIEKGKIDPKELRRNRYSAEELLEQLRAKGIFELSSVEYAVLERDGTLNVILVPAERPVTAGELCLEKEDPGYPRVVICEGRVIADNLRLCGWDERRLQKELSKNGIGEAKDVYLMTVDEAGGVYIAAEEGK